MRRILIPLVFLVLLAGLVGAVLWYFSTHPEAQAQLLSDLELQPAAPVHGLRASGFIEAEEVVISSEVGGRIRAVHVDEGDEVEAGQTLVELDTDLLQTEIARAEAALLTAQANLAQVKAGARPQEIAAAEHAVQAAKAQQAIAEEAVQAAKAQQAIAEEAVSAAEANLATAKAGLAAARARLDEAKAAYQKLLAGATAHELELARLAIEEAKNLLWAAQGQRDALGGLKEQFGGEVYVGQYESAKGQVHAAESEVKMAEVRYEQLKAGATAEEKAMARAQVKAAEAQVEQARAQVQAAEAQVEQAEAQVQVAEAQVEQAKAQVEAARAAVAQAEDQLALLEAGATDEEIAIAEAQVREAEAALEALKVQEDKMFLRSPRSGLITSRTIHEGETTAPGAVLLTVANLDELKLTVYIPEKDIGRVRVGQSVQVTVDSFPGRTFEGQVVHIATQAEFTPKNVQTQEERVKTVFGVKVRIPNPDHALKPGMPADVVIEEAGR